MIIRATSDESFEIQQLAVNTLIQFIIENIEEEEEKRFIKNFQDCMPHIYRVAEVSIKQEDATVLKNVIELVENCPKLFRQDILAVFDFGTTVR